MTTTQQIRKLCKKLAKWHWMDINPQSYIARLEDTEAALNLLWLVKGKPHKITQQHMDADFGKARTIIKKRIGKGVLVGDLILTQTPQEFLQTIEAYPETFASLGSVKLWKERIYQEPTHAAK